MDTIQLHNSNFFLINNPSITPFSIPTHQCSNSRDSPMSRDVQLKCTEEKGAHKKQKIGTQRLLYV